VRLLVSPLVPAKAGTQIQPERFVGFTGVPAFVGTSGGIDGRAKHLALRA
jgi:hypothetical protein